MKKLLIGIIGIGILVGLYFAGVKRLEQNSIRYDTSRITAVSINNVKYETTGVLVGKDAEASMREGVALLGRGPFETADFVITMPGNGSVSVGLRKPVAESKQAFLKWLQDNGYSHLDPDQFNYSLVE